jgi:ubiquinone biosynthesis protein UbiJ
MKVPQRLLQFAEKIANRVLAMDEESQQRVHALSGNTLLIKITDLHLAFYLILENDQIVLTQDTDAIVNTTISGKSFALLQLGRKQTQTKALFGNEVTISGDMELAQQIKKIMQQMDIDWEEQLSHFTGDVIAHGISQQISRTKHWLKRTSKALRENISEYLQEEARLVVGEQELEDFYFAVRETTNDVERVLIRLNKLTQCSEKSI